MARRPYRRRNGGRGLPLRLDKVRRDSFLPWAGPGIVSLLGGVAGMAKAEPRFFWLCALGIYFGLVWLLVDLCLQRFSRAAKISGSTVILTIISFFSVEWVFREHPIDVHSDFSSNDQLTDSVFGGIKWRPEYSKLTVTIGNFSARHYSDIDLLVRPSCSIAAAGILSANASVASFQDNSGLRSGSQNVPVGQKRFLEIPLVTLATEAGYRLRCEKLPADGGVITMVFALVAIKPHSADVRNIAAKNPKETVAHLTFDHGSAWTGHPEAGIYGERPNDIEKLSVTGSYVAGQKLIALSMPSVKILKDPFHAR